MHTTPNSPTARARRRAWPPPWPLAAVVVLATAGCAGNVVHSYKSFQQRPRSRRQLLRAVRPARSVRRPRDPRQDRPRPRPHRLHIAGRHQNRLTHQRVELIRLDHTAEQHDRTSLNRNSASNTAHPIDTSIDPHRRVVTLLTSAVEPAISRITACWNRTPRRKDSAEIEVDDLDTLVRGEQGYGPYTAPSDDPFIRSRISVALGLKGIRLRDDTARVLLVTQNTASSPAAGSGRETSLPRERGLRARDTARMSTGSPTLDAPPHDAVDVMLEAGLVTVDQVGHARTAAAESGSKVETLLLADGTVQGT